MKSSAFGNCRRRQREENERRKTRHGREGDVPTGVICLRERASQVAFCIIFCNPACISTVNTDFLGQETQAEKRNQKLCSTALLLLRMSSSLLF